MTFKQINLETSVIALFAVFIYMYEKSISDNVMIIQGHNQRF